MRDLFGQGCSYQLGEHLGEGAGCGGSGGQVVYEDLEDGLNFDSSDFVECQFDSHNGGLLGW